MAETAQFLTVEDAARELHVCTRTVYGLVRDGKLPARRLGRRILLSREDLAAAIAVAAPTTAAA